MSKVQFPGSLEELLRPRLEKEIAAVLKRGSSSPVKFDESAIVSAVKKASSASGRGGYPIEKAKEIAAEVTSSLRSHKIFSHSGRTIPSVEDIQDAVVATLHDRNAREIAEKISREFDISYDQIYPVALSIIQEGSIDPTVFFYSRYRETRDKVRQGLINLPFTIEIDSTDKQLHIQNVHNGKSHTFNAKLLMNLILEKTPVTYDDAQAAVKRVEGFLANRRGGEVGKEEILSIIDAALMERGYPQRDILEGRRVALTLDDVDQLVLERSAENSNIQKNNPEAVNLGIAELVLKEKALRDVFDPDVAEAHRTGAIHLHDLGYVDRVYCSAHSIEYIKRHGLDRVVANLDAKSHPAKDPRVLNNHLHTFLASIQSSYAGALGFPMLNTLYGPALLREVEVVEGKEKVRDENGEVKIIPRMVSRDILEKRVSEGDLNPENFEEISSTKILKPYSKKDMKQIAQNLVFGASQSAFSRGGQTLFIDFNIDTATPPYVTEVPALFLGPGYKRLKKNSRGEWEVIEVSRTEPKRYAEIMTDKGHVDAEGKKIQELDNKNGDVIQPEDGTVWATYGHELVRLASNQFAEALLNVSADGDKYGNPFNFPKFDVHVSKETFENPENDDLLRTACKVVEKNDSIYFLYDRGDGMNVAQCCRLRERIVDPEILKRPEKMRFCGFQNVSINLPQAGFRASGNNLEEKLASTLGEIDKTMLIALKAHTNKRRFIQFLLENDGSPMRSMGVASDDGAPYIDLSKSTYIIGILGLNELVQHITGKQMDEDAGAYKIGLRILSHMYSVKNEFTNRYGMKFVIEETPGESTNRRLAKIDLVKYPEKARPVLKGDFGRDEIYYTNSSHLRAEAPISGLDRTILQSRMNPMIEAGAITHLFTGEKNNKAEAVYDFVKTIYENTQCSQVVFSGEHTVCLACGVHKRGLSDKCPSCGNEDPDKISQKTRVVGYFSDPRQWNKSKKGELKARNNAQDFYSGDMGSLRDLESEILESVIDPGKLRVAVVGAAGCSICDMAFDKVKKFVNNDKYVSPEIRGDIEIVKYDVTTEEGRVMAAIYDTSIDTYPTIIMHRGREIVKKGWEYPYNKPATGVSTGDLSKMFGKINGQ